MAGTVFDPCSNILLEVFRQQFCKLNPGKEKDFDQQLQEIRQQLDFDDLGRAFYKRLLAKNPRLIDFDNIANNIFHCTAEFTYKNGNEGKELRDPREARKAGKQALRHLEQHSCQYVG